MEGRARLTRRGAVTRGVAVAFGAAALAALGWLLYYRATYGTFAWWQIPPRIEYCGREYDRGATAATLAGQQGTLVQVMTIEPAGRAVYAAESAHSAAPPIADLPCAMDLIVKQGGQYVQYGLSGGP